MPHYNYLCVDKNGRKVKSREFSASEQELIIKLRRRNFTIVSIKESESKIAALMALGQRRIGTFDLMVLCKQIATMVKGGVPLIKALDTIAEETKNNTLQVALIEISHYIREGESLSGALKKMSHLFSSLFISIVESGERVGALDVMLERLSRYLQARDRINRKIISAISYPAIVVIFFFGAMAAMTLFLIPKFRSIYSGLGAKLPSLTLIVFGISDFVIRNILFIVLIGGAAALYLYFQIFKTKKGRYLFDKMVLWIPIFGDVIKKAAICKFARTLSTLLGQGIPVPESLELVGKTAGSSVIEEASLRAGKLILDGEKIPEAFKKTEVFPSLLLQMTTIGVESGNLPELLDKTADFYEDQVDAFVSTMSSLIEPILIVSLGALLGVVIVALYLPIFNLSQAMSMRR